MTYNQIGSARTKLAQNLKMLRLVKDTTIYQAANEIGIAPSYLSELENQESLKNPSIEMLEKISHYYNVDVYELFI